MKLKISKLIYLNILLLLVSLPFSKIYIFSRGAYTPYTDISINLADILCFTLIILTIIQEIKLKKSEFAPKIALFILIWSAISLIWTKLPRETYNLYWFLRLFEYLTVFSVFTYLISEIKYKTALIYGILASAVIQSVIAIGQFLSQHSLGLKILGEPIIASNINGIAKIDLGSEKFIRAYGTFSHPNQLAAFMLVACATALFIYLTANNKLKKHLAAFLLILFIGSEFLSFSRAGLGALAIFFSITMLGLWIKMGWQEIKKPAEIILFSFFIFGFSLYPFLRARISPAPTEFTRTFYNSKGISIFKQNPIFGVGVGNLLPAMDSEINAQQTWQIQPPHNYFLEVACETGIVGLLLYVYLYASNLLGLIKTYAKKGERFILILIAMLIAIIFMMQFDHYFYTLPQTVLLLWIVLGMINGRIKKPHNLGL